MTKRKLPYAVILDVAYSGYGALRSLAPYNIPTIGFCLSGTSPENHTRLCTRKIFYRNTDELLQHLLQIPNDLNNMPVLILSRDEHVEFYLKHRNLLAGKYLMNMPDAKTVDLLMNKNKFPAFAEANHIIVPRSYEVKEITDLERLKSEIRYPVIIKPYKRTIAWDGSGFKKAYIVSDYEDLRKHYKTFSNTEKWFIIQEFIKGNDDHIEYCLTYFSKESTCCIAFTGKKIRQWPVGTGSTATTSPVNNDFIRAETERIFKQINFSGFGSIEYKKDLRDGKYYVMEPTVGRLNQQEYIATLSGYNIPLTAYTDLTGIYLLPKEQPSDKIIYIDELAELLSVYVHFKRGLITFPEWIKSLKGKRHFRYLNRHDPAVFFIGLLFNIVNKLLRRLGKSETR